MDQKPYFSIITPVYNSGCTLERCIKSVIAQQFANYEWLLIDGASTDNTLSIIKKYAEKNKCIKWVSEKDNGVYDAMNKGIHMAKGAWYYFLGSDDFLSNPDILKEVRDGIEANSHCKLFYGDVWYEDLNCKYDGIFTVEKLLRKNICHQAIFYHYTIFKSLGGYDLKYPVEADYVMNLKIFISGNFQPCYWPVSVAHFSAGGLSNRGNDPVFKNRYGRVVFGFLRKSKLPLYQKMKLLLIAIANIRYRTFFNFNLVCMG